MGGMKWPDVGFITGSGKWSSRRLPTHRVPHLNFPDCAIGEKNARPKGSPRLRGPERGESLWCHRIAHGFRSNEFRSVGRRCVQKFDERDFFLISSSRPGSVKDINFGTQLLCQRAGTRSCSAPPPTGAIKGRNNGIFGAASRNMGAVCDVRETGQNEWNFFFFFQFFNEPTGSGKQSAL